MSLFWSPNRCVGCFNGCFYYRFQFEKYTLQLQTKRSHYSTRFKIPGGSHSRLFVGPHSLWLAVCNPLAAGWACLTEFLEEHFTHRIFAHTLLDDCTEIVDLRLIMLLSDLFNFKYLCYQCRTLTGSILQLQSRYSGIHPNFIMSSTLAKNLTLYCPLLELNSD